MDKKVTILGASGYTGKLISKLLADTAYEIILAGRNIEVLEALRDKWNKQWIVLKVDVFSEADVKNMLEQTDILVNCVGPFSVFAQTVLNQAVMMGKIYLDITGEQEFVKNSFEQNQELAKKNHASIIHSISFESALADLMADTICSQDKTYDDISSFYYFENSRPSRGTAFTMKLSRNFNTFLKENGEIVYKKTLEKNKNVEIEGIDSLKAYFMPYPEVYFYSQRYNTQNACSYLLTTDFEANMMLGSGSKKNEDIDRLIHKFSKISDNIPSEIDRKNQKMKLVVQATTIDKQRKTIMLSGNDMYLITARLVVEALDLILSENKLESGVLFPADLFPKKDFISRIVKPNHLDMVLSD